MSNCLNQLYFWLCRSVFDGTKSMLDAFCRPVVTRISMSLKMLLNKTISSRHWFKMYLYVNIQKIQIQQDIKYGIEKQAERQLILISLPYKYTYMH